jgi:sigma-E factor negative regulatory protein RseB
MSLFSTCFAITFLSFISTGSVVADPFRQDAEWLKMIAFAAHETNYSGVFIYQAGANKKVEASRITHLLDSTGEHEHLESLDGVHRELVRHNDQVWLYLGDRKVRVERRQYERRFPALLPEQLIALQENYFIKQGEEDRVAGFHTHTMVLQPKDNLRYTHKLWLHSESGLLLKAVVTDEHGQVIEQYAFTQLVMGSENIDRQWVTAGKAGLDERTPLLPLPKAGLEVYSSGWQIDAMPVGFKKILEMRRTLHNKKSPVMHLVFSDGLAGVSVFIEDSQADPAPVTGLNSNGSVQIYSRIAGDKLITVVGEVPPRAVIQIAESIRFAGQ